MPEKKVITLSQHPADFAAVADKLTSAISESVLPIQHKHSYYDDAQLSLFVGVIASTDLIATTTPDSDDRFIAIIAGTAAIKHPETGVVTTFSAGDSLVVPHGHHCLWQKSGYVRMFYVTLKPNNHSAIQVTPGVISIDEKSNHPWQVTTDGHRKKVLYQNQQFTAGVWQSKAFNTGSITFPYNEFIVIKYGSLICTDEQGVAHNISAGDALFIAQGTRCAWQTSAKISLYFVQIKP